MYDFRLKVFERASICRNFEDIVYFNVQHKVIKYPVYLSAGQEFISATIAQYLAEKKINPDIFIQHRGHSTYLSFGGKIEELIDELLGRSSGCANGMGGSASIQCKDKNIYGHDGLMGSQAPIGVGACYVSSKPTIIFIGDSAAEEDYVLSSIGWAATKNLPVLFVIEDNNLSILTKKKVRRSWEMDDIAKGFGVKSFNISDSPVDIKMHMEAGKVFEQPLLLNINTVRKYWHAGAGIDDENVFDRYQNEMDDLGKNAIDIDEKNKVFLNNLWQKQLEKQ